MLFRNQTFTSKTLIAFHISKFQVRINQFVKEIISKTRHKKNLQSRHQKQIEIKRTMNVNIRFIIKHS